MHYLFINTTYVNGLPNTMLPSNAATRKRRYYRWEDKVNVGVQDSKFISGTPTRSNVKPGWLPVKRGL